MLNALDSFIICTRFRVKNFIEDFRKGCGNVGLAEEEERKEEKIDGVIYDMSPSANYIHGMVNSNIHTKVKAGLRDSLCLSFMENLDFKYQPEESDNYVIPDVMVICDRKRLRGGSYSGVPKFIVETLSPSTARNTIFKP